MELRRTRRSPRRFRAPGGTGHRLLWPVMPRQSGAADRRQKPIVCPTLTTQLGCSSAALYYTPLNSSQAATTLPWPKSEGRKSIAQCASTGNHAQDALAPERGVRIRARGIFRPVPGLVNWRPGPRAVRPGLVSFALRALCGVCCLRLCRYAGQVVNLRRVGNTPVAQRRSPTGAQDTIRIPSCPTKPVRCNRIPASKGPTPSQHQGSAHSSMAEVADAGEDHGDAEAVGGGDDLIVAYGTAGLNEGGGAILDGFFDAIGKGKEGVGSDGGAR